MAGIVAALKADHGVGSLGEEVNDRACALIAPLGANTADRRHASDSTQAGRNGPIG